MSTEKAIAIKDDFPNLLDRWILLYRDRDNLLKKWKDWSKAAFISELERIVKEQDLIRPDLFKFLPRDDFVFDMDIIPGILKRAYNIRNDAGPAFIYGPTGSGKTEIAYFIHKNSNRSDKPFITLNCSQFSDDSSTFNDKLFGHVRGAFTGAVGNVKGCIEQAEGGTLFLDEIGTASKATQERLLTILDRNTFDRLGENKPKHDVNCRFIFATNQKLSEMVKNGEYKFDLLSRICFVHSIKIPPLREFGFVHLATLMSRRIYSKLGDLAAAQEQKMGSGQVFLLEHCEDHQWPGNIREFLSWVDGCIAQNKWEKPMNLDSFFDSVDTNQNVEPLQPWDKHEKDYYVKLFKASKGIVEEMMRKSGHVLSRKVINNRLKKYQIQ